MFKLVQFGEGNFLRAFADVYFDALAREQGGCSVTVVPPRRGDLSAFRRQQCRYHAVLRGVENGAAVERVCPVNVISAVVDAAADPGGFFALARDPETRLIVSNTTEAGICFRPGDRRDDLGGASFPGRLTLLLYERFRAGLDGVYLLPAELIDDNAAALLACVEKYIALWGLPQEFLRWNREKCFYCSTLVDRIVSGRPRDEATRAHLEGLLGQKDELLTVGEPFGLWVIERKGDVERYIKAGTHGGVEVVLTDSVAPYKTRKVRVLNGSHTNLVAAGLWYGAKTVYDCMNEPRLAAFVKKTLDEEILPFVPNARKFADDVLERFANPYLDHQLTSIALNSVSKWRARVLPTFRDYVSARGALPPRLTAGLSCLMALYARTERRGDGYAAALPGGDVPVQDERAYLDYFAGGGDVRGFLSDADAWGEDLCAYPGLADAVEKNIVRLNAGECLL